MGHVPEQRWLGCQNPAHVGDRFGIRQRHSQVDEELTAIMAPLSGLGRRPGDRQSFGPWGAPGLSSLRRCETSDPGLGLVESEPLYVIEMTSTPAA